MAQLAEDLVSEPGPFGLRMAVVSHRHPARIEADDHVGQATETAGALRTSRGVKLPARSRGVSGSIDPPDRGQQRLRCRTVAAVPIPGAARVAALMTEMIGQFRLEGPARAPL